MSMPSDIGVIDTMLGIPSTDKSGSYNWLRPLLRDRESLEAFEFPVQYQYRDRPDVPGGGTVDDMIDFTVEQMDKYGIARALLDVDLKESPGARAIERYPDRFFGSAEPVLLDQRVRAKALPRRHRELREHPRGRQGAVRRLLPLRPLARANFPRAAGRAVSRARLAEVPARQRSAGVQAR